MLSTYSIGSFLIILVGYTTTSLLLRGMQRKESEVERRRHPLHNYFASTNLFVAACFAALVTELAINNRTSLSTGIVSAYGWPSLILAFLKFVLWESVLEYYWHRAMHLDWFYARMHKYHHFYKEPEPFDDMFIFPPEAFGYYCILYSPAFVFQTHYFVFISYMILMGLCGILDHCGLKISVPLYSSVDHDVHHAKFKFNYGFPFPFMDVIHGTYLRY